MKLKITTLVIVEGNQVENIYHSLEDNQDKAYQDLINQVNATYGDGGVLQFKNRKGNDYHISHTQGNRGNIHYLPTDTERKAIHQI
jgi:hypothetical protein